MWVSGDRFRNGSYDGSGTHFLSLSYIISRVPSDKFFVKSRLLSDLSSHISLEELDLGNWDL